MLGIETFLNNTRSAKVTPKEILVFSKLKSFEKQENSQSTKDFLWIFGMEKKHRFKLLRSTILEQFISISDSRFIEKIFDEKMQILTFIAVDKLFKREVRKFESKPVIIRAAEYLKSCIILITPRQHQIFHTQLPSTIENKVPIVIMFTKKKHFLPPHFMKLGKSVKAANT